MPAFAYHLLSWALKVLPKQNVIPTKVRCGMGHGPPLLPQAYFRGCRQGKQVKVNRRRAVKADAFLENHNCNPCATYRKSIPSAWINSIPTGLTAPCQGTQLGEWNMDWSQAPAHPLSQEFLYVAQTYNSALNS